MMERVGEAFMLGFRGLELPDWLVDFEAAHGLGGVLLFDRDLETPGALRNVESPEQLRALCGAVHALPSRPLVCVDQEGGRVRRLKPELGFAELPSARALAGLEASAAERVLATSYAEMRDLGIDLVLAPVVDLDTNPDNPNIGAIERSFSARPEEVRRCVFLFAEVARRTGLQLCLKHYPGLGGAATDSHLELTDVTGCNAPEQEALFLDLAPRIPGNAVMLSHGIDRERDAEAPASISPAIISALRSRLPDTLFITDDIQMQGLRAICSTVDACLRSVRGGVDLLCIGNNLHAERDECRDAALRLAGAAASEPELEASLERAIARVAVRKVAARR
jgi:beta-N-acetylhexosaminidase